MAFTSLESFNVQEEKKKDMNELLQSCLTVCPKLPVGIASIAATLVIAAIIIAAKRM